MKKMNMLETQLRSWTPRRPSSGLERRLFPAERVHLSISRLITVLTPAAACVLLTVSMMRQSAQELLSIGNQRAAVVAMGLSNQNYAAYLPGACQSTANRVDTFEWTNRGYSNSSMDSFTSPKATDLQ
jgi:hypothetical protein